MLDGICNIIAKIVFSNIDGKILIIPLFVLVYVLVGQAKEFRQEFNLIFREEEVE